jgi:YggT family protein
VSRQPVKAGLGQAGLAVTGPERLHVIRLGAGDDPMNQLLIDILSFVSYLLFLYVILLIAAAVLSWLIAFNVVNARNQFVMMLWQFLYRITEPVLRPIRNLLPDLGGIDISPIIIILIIEFIRQVVIPNLQRALL